MPKEIRIYCEGDRLLRPGFVAFFGRLRERVLAKGGRLEVIAAGSGDAACRDFDDALESHPTAWNILLIDREGPPVPNMSAVLCRQQGWNTSHSDSIFWMVEMMESWFYADKDKLREFYGPDFRGSALKANPNVEKISKKDLKDRLRAATKDTKKGNYFDHKTSHGPKLLELIRPDLVQKAAPNCRKLFQVVLAQLP